MRFPFENTFARLPDSFYVRVDPTPVTAPQMIALNHSLAGDLGLDPESLDGESGTAIFSGNRLPEGAEPLAAAYSGHQFGGFSPVLGDGRAILLGELIHRDGAARDIQLKGSGPTPFSRRGDGRSALGPVLREYLVSEAMAALGIPTTRALAAVWSGDTVYREEVEPGGVFTRIARSHLRIGTCEYFASRGDLDSLKLLVDYALQRHYPEQHDTESPALALLTGVMERQASLVARWMGVGFIHGVMNTDNMSLSGETIDYGPCAFLDLYQSSKRYSFIDRNGRYAYGNQPNIAQWNLARLAEALLPLVHSNEAKSIALVTAELERFPELFRSFWTSVFGAKLGFSMAGPAEATLAEDLLALMETEKIDFTLAFRHLRNSSPENFHSLFSSPERSQPWWSSWQARLGEVGQSTDEARRIMETANPIYIPRNHRVEEVITAGKNQDFGPFHRLHAILQHPFVEQADATEFENPPLATEEVQATFCGT